MPLVQRLEAEGYRKMSHELIPDAIDLGPDAALPARFTLGEMGMVWARDLAPALSEYA